MLFLAASFELLSLRRVAGHTAGKVVVGVVGYGNKFNQSSLGIKFFPLPVFEQRLVLCLLQRKITPTLKSLWRPFV